MKTITNIVGILLIIFGIVSLGYQGITYNKQEDVAKIGSVKITANEEKTIFLPPVFGGIALVAGLALVVIARMGKS
jgi:vacuolar-type H+-ATPase subunit I/STV1